MLLRSQKIALNPNNKQATWMSQNCGYARVAYNHALADFKEGLDNNEFRSASELSRRFNAVKDEKYEWCRKLSQRAASEAIFTHLGDAIQRWTSGQNRFPKFKNRACKHSYTATSGQEKVKIQGKKIRLPKIGWVRMYQELRFTGEIRKVVISRRGDRWFASILIGVHESNCDYQPILFDDRQPIGVDVGINTLATCSNGDVFENPRPLKRYERKLRRENRKLSRKQLRSKNWYKQQRKLGRLHYRIACIREDAHHQATTKIVRKASAIGIETLNISGLLKNRRLAKALSDSRLSGFLTMLKYKAERRGIPITEADRFFASSKTCSNCGHIKDDLTLSDRMYHCTECGFESDRDVNAAINLCPM